MRRPHLIGMLGTLLSTFIAVSAHAALIGVLPATTGGTDWQAYYDDQLDITWMANANLNDFDTWDNQVAWAASLNIDGVTGWRLPSMDVNGDGIIVGCLANQTACKDNEYGHLFSYGAGTVYGSGIVASSPGTNSPSPFSNVRSGRYWSGTDSAPTPSTAWFFDFFFDAQFEANKRGSGFAWAVRSGNISAVPVPAAVWLFGSGLLGLLELTRRKRADT